MSASSIRMGYFENGMMENYCIEMQTLARHTVIMNRFGNATDLLNGVNFAFEIPYFSSGIMDLNGGLNLG